MPITINARGEVYGYAWMGHISLIPTKKTSEPDVWKFEANNFMETVTILTSNRKRLEELIEKLYG